MSRYHYLPVGARGRGARVRRTPDTLAPVLARPDGKPLSALPVGCSSTTTTPVDVPLRRLRPGRRRRDRPARPSSAPTRCARTADFEPNYLACIEFDNPDFPWLFTPAAAGSNGRLRPWLVLGRRCGRARTAALRSSRELPLPQARRARSPSCPTWPSRGPGRTRRSSQIDASQPVDQILLTAQPDQNLSRLLCPRRLEPETRYLACVVPAFDAGRKAGLGEEVTAADEDQLAPAWDAAKPVVTLPVYYHWEFATGSGGDFETLARRLKPQPVGGGRRPPAAARRARSRSACRTAACSSSRARSSRPGRSRGRRRPTRSATRCASCVNLADGRAGRGAAGLRPLAVGARRPSPPTPASRPGCAS